MLEINKWIDSPNKVQIKNSIREIFFLSSSRKSFSDEQDRDIFFARWTEYYFEKCPELILYATTKNLPVAGYATFCNDSIKALPHFKIHNPSYCLFEEQFQDYSGHLHINCHPDSRGQGIGSLILQAGEVMLKRLKCSGVHLITSPESPNVNFYRKNGYDFEIEKQWKNFPLLFMGKKLSTVR